MERFLSNVKLKVNEHVYLKDPESSKLGKKIIQGSIALIEEFGFEAFTFKKLANHINSTEASIYRYFENKTKILLYLTVWYWSWMESRLLFRTANIEDKEQQLKIAIKILTSKVEEDGNFAHINEVKLHRIISVESSKSYLNQHVDDENKHGVFSSYKNIVGRVSDIMLGINPKFDYPNMLTSTIIEGAHLQRFFAEHLPGLTNQTKNKDDIESFYTVLALNALKKDK
ncbi:MAG: TetR family transcriptional regulator [Fluviicola sp.]|jgi:AcrR family transcriptional regulator|nr:MAG: TetR family transcriptional regulator [Fluviicola sp.]